MLCSRPAESFQVNPALSSNTATSDSLALEYFCNRTPRPRAISGTWSSGNSTILWLVPITATVSPASVAIAQASFGMVTLSTCLPLRVLPTQSSSLTTKPCPSLLAIRNLRSPLLMNSDTIAAAARQFCDIERIEFAVGRKQQQLRRGFGEEGVVELVVGLERKPGDILD